SSSSSAHQVQTGSSTDSSSSSPDGSPSSGAHGGQPADQHGQGQTASADGAAGRSDSSAQSQASGQQGSDAGSSAGKGSAEHLGAPNDFQGLAQREVVVPNDPNVPPSSIGPSNQLQTGAVSSAQVDYVDVLPKYR